jgi:hypothetical protein
MMNKQAVALKHLSPVLEKVLQTTAKVLNYINISTRSCEDTGEHSALTVSLDDGSPTSLWQRPTPVIVGWFVGHTWKYNGKWYI